MNPISSFNFVFIFQELEPGYVLKNPELARTLKKQLSNENSKKPKTKTQSVPEQPKVSVPISINQQPIFQSIKFIFVYIAPIIL